MGSAVEHVATPAGHGAGRKLRVLLSAYACEPGRGSEPEIGWNWAQQMAMRHDVWIVTRESNRAAIERALPGTPAERARFVYVDLPRGLRGWKKLPGGVYAYYYLWQALAWRKARALDRRVEFDYAHHVTFGTYWLPSFLAFMPAPYIWGPVGGGETAPAAFRRSFSFRGKAFELARRCAQGLARYDPLLRLTARRAALALATTEQTEERLRALGSRSTAVALQVGMAAPERERLFYLPRTPHACFRVASAGRLLHWKGFHLALRAIAILRERGCGPIEYWVFGDGSERRRLEEEAARLGIADNVWFFRSVSRGAFLQKLGECDALVHPSLHESGGYVCMEAMAAGLPVVCFDLGGPSLQVSEDTGLRVRAGTPEQAVSDLADALERLALDPELCQRMGRAAQERVAGPLSWEARWRAVWRMICTAPPSSAASRGDG